MTKHILVSILLLALLGICYCAAKGDWAFTISFAIALLVCVNQVIDEHNTTTKKKGNENRGSQK